MSQDDRRAAQETYMTGIYLVPAGRLGAPPGKWRLPVPSRKGEVARLIYTFSRCCRLRQNLSAGHSWRQAHSREKP